MINVIHVYRLDTATFMQLY